MLKRNLLFAMLMICGAISSSYTSGGNNQSGSFPANAQPQNQKTYDNNDQNNLRHGSGREDIAYEDERDADIHRRANRKGDWDYKQNWRYNREAFYRGETQGEAYLDDHPEGSGGPGMNPDKEFLEMRKHYLQDQQQGAQRPTSNQNNYPQRGY